MAIALLDFAFRIEAIEHAEPVLQMEPVSMTDTPTVIAELPVVEAPKLVDDKPESLST